MYVKLVMRGRWIYMKWIYMNLYEFMTVVLPKAYVQYGHFVVCWCNVGALGGFLHSFWWCSWCDALARGPITSATCIGEHVATLGCSLVV